MIYLVSLFIWTFMEIAFQNYVGWLAAGHYWSNQICQQSLFGQCTIYTQGISEKLSMSYIYFTMYTKPHQIMAIGPLRTYYLVLDLMMITTTATMVLYIFVVHERLHKAAFFFISILSPRHLAAFFVGEFLKAFFTHLYTVIHGEEVHPRQRDDRHDRGFGQFDAVNQGDTQGNPYLNSTRRDQTASSASNLEVLDKDELQFERDASDIAFSRVYPLIFAVANIRKQPSDYFPDEPVDSQFGYEVLYAKVHSIRYNALVGNFRYFSQKAKTQEESFIKLSKTLRDQAHQIHNLQSQLDQITELYKQATSFNSNLVRERVQYQPGEVKPQAPQMPSLSYLSKMATFVKNKVSGGDFAQIKNQKDDQKEVQVNQNSIIHNQAHMIIEEDPPQVQPVESLHQPAQEIVSQTSSEEMNVRLNQLELDAYNEVQQQEEVKAEFEGGSASGSAVKRNHDEDTDKMSAKPPVEDELDDDGDNIHYMPLDDKREHLSERRSQLQRYELLSQQEYDQYESITSGFRR